MRILRASDHRVMPWKNGGGSTTEIAVAPEGAGIDGFDWRISMAVVAGDGPFSAFPGIDRSLSVLEGAGLVLHGLPGGPVRLDRGSPPFAFPADADVAATLVDGPITDLNVMTRRGKYRARVRRIAEAGDVVVKAPLAFLIAETPCVAAVDGLEAGLTRRDAVRLDAVAGRRLGIAGDGPVEAYLVEFLTAPA